MANYSITVNSKFKPFSYQELLAPVLLATQAHQDVEEKYGELETKANMYEKIANANPESKAASMYKKFSDDLRNAANELAINGLSPSSRKAMLDMKSRYSNEIQPIEYAVAAQSNLAKQAASQNPQLRMRYQEMPSIDDLIANPNMERRGYSGADIEKSVMTSAAAASAREWLSQFSKDPKNAGFMKQVQKMGYNVNTMKDIKDIPELNAIIQQVKDQFGYGNDDRLSQYNKDMLDAEILSGLFKGVTYKENVSYQQDPVYMAHLNDSLARARMRYQKELDGIDNLTDPFGGLRSRNVLSADSGDFKQYGKLVNAFLFGETSPRKGKLKPTYFGKVYHNPLKIYEEYKKLINEDKNEKIISIADPFYTPTHSKAKEIIKKKYGVTSILTDEEAKALQKLGYTNNSTFNDFKGITDRVHKEGKKYSFNSVNVPDLSVPSEYAMSELYRRSNLGDIAFKNTLWYEDKNGKLGKMVKDLDELELNDKDQMTDVFYGTLHPNLISISLGKHTLYADPSILDAQDIVNSAAQELSKNKDPEIRDIIQKATTTLLRKKLQAWNPNPSKTSSK